MTASTPPAPHPAPAPPRAPGGRTWPDDRLMAVALQGLVTGSGVWRQGVLAGLEATGRFLTGPADGSAELVDGPAQAARLEAVGDGYWTRFIGRIGAVALRAVAPSTRPDRRELLLALLEVWADSPFADPRARLRTGVARTERWAVRDARGAAVAVYWAGEGRRRFVELRTGDADPPALGPVEEAEEVRRGWGDPDQLRRLLARYRERGPVPWDPQAPAVLAEGTGMGRAAAALTLAGLPGGVSYLPFFDAREREVLGLKAAAAEDGNSELNGLSALQRLDLLADVLPEDPERLWEPGGLRAVAERTAAAWRERHGRRPLPPERTAAAVAQRKTPLAAAEFCGLLMEPGANGLLTAEDPVLHLEPWEDGRLIVSGPRWRTWRFDQLLDIVVPELPWVYADLPAGDPVRAGVPGFVRLARERLRHPDLPLDEVVAQHLYDPYGDRAVVPWLLGPVCTRMAERIRDGGLPPGAYESDPRASVPALVARAAEALGVDEDAAVLHLQLLALPAPTDRSVRRWNGWSPAVHKRAAAALLERGAVVEDKRPRAGRTLFLPGQWAPAAGTRPPGRFRAPMERWKAELHGAVLSPGGEVRGLPLPTRTLPELFAAAWALVERGEGPA